MTVLPIRAVVFGQTRKPAKKSLIVALQDEQQSTLWHRSTVALKRGVAAFSGKKRRQHLEELATSQATIEISEAEQAANRSLTIALGSLTTIAISKLGFPILIAVGAAGVVYLNLPFIKASYVDLVKHRKLNSLILYPLLVSGAFMSGLWFEAAVSMSTFALARKLLARTRTHSRNQLVNIMGEQPRYAWVAINGTEVRLPFEQITAGDVIVIGAGEMIPIDGVIVTGNASIDQHALTGESQPAEKGVGEEVLAATIVLAGKIFVRVVKTGNETVAAKIGEILNNSADFELAALSRSDRIIDDSLLPTLALSVVAIPVAGLGGFMGVLLASFGYNLRILSPISMLNFLQIAADKGILIKDGQIFEELSTVDTFVFDKTGTLTLEQPTVAKVHTFGKVSADDVLALAAAAENRQSHPIAKAILVAAAERNLTPPAIEEATYELGYGIKVGINGDTIRVGSDRFMRMEAVVLPTAMKALQKSAHAQGYSLVIVAQNNRPIGAIELRPTIRPEAGMIVKDLKQRGMHTVIISGDQEEPTRKLATELGIDTFFANTLPQNKALHVEQLQSLGKKVCFVGDGINDAIALRKADVSISLRGATTAATDTAQIIFMNANLAHLPDLLDLGQRFEKNMDMNLAWSIIPGVVMIGGIFIFHASFLSVIGLMNAGLAVGVANAMLPLWQVDRED